MGLCQQKWRFAIKPRYDAVGDFSDGLAPVQTNGKWGFIDMTGKVIIPLQFDEADSFSEKLAAVQTDDKWGYINRTGTFVITPQFDDARHFSENLAAARSGNRWGYITKKGSFEIPPAYANAYDFSPERFALVETGGESYYIHPNGKKVTGLSATITAKAAPASGKPAARTIGGKATIITDSLEAVESADDSRPQPTIMKEQDFK